MFTKFSVFLSSSFFEKKYKISCAVARLITQTFYKSQFKTIGARSWIKKPAQVFCPSNITIGQDVRIEAGSVLYSVSKYLDQKHDGRIVIGDAVFANSGFKLSAVSSISVGDGVAFGYNVFISDFDHDYRDIAKPILAAPLISKGPVSIGKNSWIGANVFVGSGVQLGEHCVVAANSVVTKSFPSYSIVGGNPARLIRLYDHSLGKWVKADD